MSTYLEVCKDRHVEITKCTPMDCVARKEVHKNYSTYFKLAFPCLLTNLITASSLLTLQVMAGHLGAEQEGGYSVF